MTSIVNPRIAASLVLAGVLAAALPARAEQPVSDTKFLASHLPAVETVKTETLAKPVTSLNILDGIRQIVSLRRQALTDLNKVHPLTSLDGIETMDDYDDKAVLAMHDLTSAYAAADTTRPDPQQLQQFNAVLGGIPTLGESPVGFMVFGIADMALMVADTLWSAPAVSKSELAKTAVSLIHLAGERYTGGKKHSSSILDPAFAQKSGQFRRNSVIMRMRCPKDNSVYRIVDVRSRTASNGDMLSTYYIQCQTCNTPRVIEFVRELQSKLNRVADKQEGQEKRKPAQAGKGVEP